MIDGETKFVETDEDEVDEADGPDLSEVDQSGGELLEEKGSELINKLMEVLPPDLLYEQCDSAVDREIRIPTFKWREFCLMEVPILLEHHDLELPENVSVESIADDAVTLFIELALVENRHDLKIPAQAMLRLCMKKILYYKYKLHFELDGFPKKYYGLRRSAADCPNEADQRLRNNRLCETQSTALADPNLRMEVVDLVQVSLLLKMLPEMFRRDGYQEMEAEQLNDLSVNFLFWTLRNNPVFNRKHILLMYFTLFICPDEKAVLNEM